MSNTRSTTPRRGVSVETTASFPNPAQDYFEGHLSLDRHLVRRPTSTFVLRVSSDALASMGIRAGDEVLVDRALDPAPGRVLVVVVDSERRLGRFDIVDGRAVLATDLEQIPLTSDVEPWGVATVLLHHLPLGPAGDRDRRNYAR
ncbi:DNA polymerase V [Nocardioides aromaticivorans]|uniref:DNA polymerase V n=1 Tax=Nocardioides aromaticivorans TaxID=200618 RepID=A0A7Y9ZMZ4_9ACTN|nr:S24 family peptidase [Nocardioides aromaticivorans]NYI47841.1 DNA polymerase V [Nocardioides aromaticivorans]